MGVPRPVNQSLLQLNMVPSEDLETHETYVTNLTHNRLTDNSFKVLFFNIYVSTGDACSPHPRVLDSS